MRALVLVSQRGCPAIASVLSTVKICRPIYPYRELCLAVLSSELIFVSGVVTRMVPADGDRNEASWVGASLVVGGGEGLLLA